MAGNTLEKAEKELSELQDILKNVETKIRETGGQKSQVWVFDTRHKIYKLEEKIEDLKVNKIRTDKLPSESVEIERRITNLTDSLEKISKGKE